VDCHRTQELGLTLLGRVPMPASYTHTTSLNTLVIISNIYSNSLHTSFLRVIMHHGALLAGSTAGLPLVKKHNRTTDTTVALSCELPETTAGAKAGVATGGLIWFIIEMDQPQSFGDFGHGSQPTAVHQVNLRALLLLPIQEQGDLASTGDEELLHEMQETLRSLAKPNGRSTSCAFPSPTTTTTLLQPEGPTTSLQSLFVQTTMEPLPHGL